MVVGILAVASTFISIFLFNRSFKSDELGVILGIGVILVYIGYYVSRGGDIPLPQVMTK